MENIISARVVDHIAGVSLADLITVGAEERTGYSARFTRVEGGNVLDYEGKVDWDKSTVKPYVLELTNQKYFAMQIDDIEALKTNPQEIDNQAKRVAREISKNEDKFILDTIKKGAGKTISRTIAEPKQAYDALVDANKELSIADAPFNDRFIVIDFHTLGMVEKDPRFTANYELLENGLLQGASINGAKVIATNSLPANTILALQVEGTGFERFLDKVEVMRLENAFADGIRGLDVYDGIVLDKNSIVAVTVTGAETK